MNQTAGILTLLTAALFIFGCTSHADDLSVSPQNNKGFAPKSVEPFVSASLKKPGSGLYFIDTRTGWVLAHGKLYATVDGGGSWTTLNSDDLSNCQNAVFANQSLGWVLCDSWTTKRRSNSILVTRNGGASWHEVLEVPTPVYTLNFLNDRVGYVSSRWHPLHRSLDGGKAWTELDGIEGLNYVYFVDEKKGWGYGGALWHTNDGGDTWKQTLSFDQVGELWSASFTNSATGWIVGGHELWRTTDGDKWLPVNGIAKHSGEFLDIDFINLREGWISVNDGSILHSIDGGLSWQVQAVLPVTPRTLRFVTNLKGWILGTNGELMRSEDGGQTWIAVPLREKQSTNHPN